MAFQHQFTKLLPGVQTENVTERCKTLKKKVFYTVMQTNSDLLQNNILRTIAYFDVFSYPLTVEQLFSFLPQNSVTVNDVAVSVNEMVLAKKLVKEGNYLLFPGESGAIALRRTEDERRASAKLRIAKIVARFIKCFPFVRAIFLTGSLSKNVADESSDIDFMIVTAPERLWVTRTMLTVFRKIFLLGSSKYFCTNFYVTERGYAQPQRNMYTAIEVVTVKAIWNSAAFDAFQSCNGWTKQFLPNASAAADPDLLISSRRSLFQSVIEFILSALPLGRINVALMEYHRTHWTKVFSSVDPRRLNSMFMISHDISSGWPDDRQESILDAFHRKVASLEAERT